MHKPTLANTSPHLVTKAVLAKELSLTTRGVDSLVLRKKIPVLRISRKMVRFDLAKVLAALERDFEIQALSSGVKGGI